MADRYVCYLRGTDGNSAAVLSQSASTNYWVASSGETCWGRTGHARPWPEFAELDCGLRAGLLHFIFDRRNLFWALPAGRFAGGTGDRVRRRDLAIGGGNW